MKTVKKLISITLCAVLLLLPLGLISTAADTYGPGSKFVVLGDSIAAGEGASEGAKCYAKLIADEKNFELSNFAVGGHDSFQLMEVMEDEAVRDAIAEADIINLSIGGNDLLHANVITIVLRIMMGDTSLVEPYLNAFRENFAFIVEDIRALNPGALFIVQTLYNPMDGIPLVGDAYEAANVMLNDIYFEYLEENPGAYEIADIHGIFAGRGGLIFGDRVHPSDSGHALIAKVLTAMIDGTELDLDPVEPFEPNFFQKIGIFWNALVDYLSYWLSVYSLWELIGKAVSFI
ncbi:MAG: GDSL-type esterase/lipase family protein [Oscillospiraceae bacterium]|nr:GDSL-type esterase/lipase family protein [Oscillospiraceae bacterium]